MDDLSKTTGRSSMSQSNHNCNRLFKWWVRLIFLHFAHFLGTVVQAKRVIIFSLFRVHPCQSYEWLQKMNKSITDQLIAGGTTGADQDSALVPTGSEIYYFLVKELCILYFTRTHCENNLLSEILQSWTDEFLVWNETEWDGIKRVNIPTSKIWLPDGYIFDTLVYSYFWWWLDDSN